MTPEQRQALFDNTARAMRGCSGAIHARHIANCAKAHPEYGHGVASAIAALEAAHAMQKEAIPCSD
jgi:catalase